MSLLKTIKLSASIAGLTTTLLLSTHSAIGANGNFMQNENQRPIVGEILPTGKRITPEVANGALFQPLNPELESNPEWLADHAVESVISPDGSTLLILTSGYNRVYDVNADRPEEDNNEYVFVYDISEGTPVKQQVIKVPNTFNGIAWNPNGSEFYVSGGVDDNLHIYGWTGQQWEETTTPIELGHEAGEGVSVRPLAAGVAVNASGTEVLVANYENDSVSLINLEAQLEMDEQDLRPGIIDEAKTGEAGGTYPLDVVFMGDNKAYVSSQRDREIIVLSVDGGTLDVLKRISTEGQPTKMILNAEQSKLFVASDNDDSVVMIDTDSDEIDEVIATIAPKFVFSNKDKLRGVNPNNLALSPDEKFLYVTNGGTNSVAVIRLGKKIKQRGFFGGYKKFKSEVVGLIPTGWYPNAVAVTDSMIYVVNGKSNAGPNPEGCRDTLSIESGSLDNCRSANQYVWQLHKAGFLAMPQPTWVELFNLTWQVAVNNSFRKAVQYSWHTRKQMKFIEKRIDHVVYVVKENRTYDQILGALEVGNGDPDLAIMAPYSPNHIQLARQFYVLDNFYDSGETSNTGWNWTTAARATDFTEKTAPVNYAGRGLTYDWEGANRNVMVSEETLEGRMEYNPDMPEDPNMLPGTADVAAPDSSEGEAGAGYLWDAALRKGLTVRNYGFFVANQGDFGALTEEEAANTHEYGLVQAVARKQSLKPYTDPYFRGYDQRNSDVILYKEWEREFDEFVEKGELPNLSLVRFPHDHFGSFSSAKWDVNTVETQMADNDYAVGLLIEKIANSPFAHNTLVFVVEDDAQNGGDHVDPHRSIAYVVGPYVKQTGEVISRHYTSASMVRTIVDVLGLEPLGINDGLTDPMVEVFDRHQKDWDYKAIVPEVLYSTRLPLPDPATALVSSSSNACDALPVRDAKYWEKAMAGQDFKTEDNLDTDAFNSALWEGIKGEDVAQPGRHRRDLSENRDALLAEYKAKRQAECKLELSAK